MIPRKGVNEELRENGTLLQQCRLGRRAKYGFFEIAYRHRYESKQPSENGCSHDVGVGLEAQNLLHHHVIQCLTPLGDRFRSCSGSAGRLWN